MNVCTIAGNVGKVQEVRHLQNGTPVLGFSVAVNGRKKNDGTRDTTWFDCGLFGTRATALAPYIQAGDKVTVSGSIALNTFTDRNGQTQAALKLNVSEMTLQSGNRHGGQTQRGRQPQPMGQPAPAQQQSIPADSYDDDISF